MENSIIPIQAVTEHLPNNSKALSSNPSIAKEKDTDPASPMKRLQRKDKKGDRSGLLIKADVSVSTAQHMNFI
jgi:hypothetical protein